MKYIFYCPVQTLDRAPRDIYSFENFKASLNVNDFAGKMVCVEMYMGFSNAVNKV